MHISALGSYCKFAFNKAVPKQALLSEEQACPLQRWISSIVFIFVHLMGVKLYLFLLLVVFSISLDFHSSFSLRVQFGDAPVNILSLWHHQGNRVMVWGAEGGRHRI